MTGGKKDQTGREMPACQPAVMGLRQRGGMGAPPGVRTHVGDRVLEPGSWSGSTRAPQKTRHKISRADGNGGVNAEPESSGDHLIGTK